LRKKPDGIVANIHVSSNERSGKPAIPERPPGLIRPSSLIRQQTRAVNENVETDPGVSIEINVTRRTCLKRIYDNHL
jgi:hypothetical protein